MDAILLIQLIIFGIIGLIMIIVALVFLSFLTPWFWALIHGTPINLYNVVGIRLRRAPVDLIVDSYIELVRTDVPVSIQEVEDVYFRNKARRLDVQELARLVRERKAEETS